MREPPPQPRPKPRDIQHYMISGRFPNLNLVFQRASPVYGLLGGPFGLKLSAIDVRLAKPHEAGLRVSLQYANGLQSLDLRHPSDASSRNSIKAEWSEQYEFAFKHNIGGDPSSAGVSIVPVESLWTWSDTEWLAKLRLDGNALFLGVTGLATNTLDVLLQSIGRIDNHPESIADQQSQLWKRMEEL